MGGQASHVFMVAVMVAVFISYTDLTRAKVTRDSVAKKTKTGPRMEMKQKSPKALSKLHGTRIGHSLPVKRRMTIENPNGDSEFPNLGGNPNLPVIQLHEVKSHRRRVARVGDTESIDKLDQTRLWSDYDDFDQLPPSTPCEPQEVSVRIANITNDFETDFIPPCLLVPICKGCCGSRTCMVKKKSRKYFSYMRFKDGKETEENFYYDYHQECTFKCQTQPEHCNDEAHYYDIKRCACACRYSRLCNQNQKFNYDKCDCECKNTTSCSQGDYFSVIDCKCHRLAFYPKSGVRTKPEGYIFPLDMRKPL